jgi:Icc-related predicted phosphoesterase
MRITAIADLQNQCQKIDPSQIPMADLLIVAGDLTNYGDLRDLVIFNMWLGKLKHKHKAVILGNHENGAKYISDLHGVFTNATLLHDELIEIEGFKIFGSPVNECGPYKNMWSYCEPEYIKRICSLIPKCDILITHGPPLGILDPGISAEHIGSPEILEAVERIKPLAHVFGHAHSGYGIFNTEETLFVNGALCDEGNRIVDVTGKLLRKPLMFSLDLKPKLGQV